MGALAVALLLVGLAIAVNGVEATPSEAAPSALTLSVERPLYVIPSVRTRVPVRFQITGRAGRVVEVWHCRNGRFGPADVWLSWPPCSSNDSVFSTGDWQDDFTDEFGDAGRYQSYARTTGELSNVVTFTVLDECRWTVIRDAQRFGHSEPGMPYHCDHLRNGPLELRADDGTRLISTGYGSAGRSGYYPNRLSSQDYGFSIGEVHNWPSLGSLRLKLGPKIGSFLIYVHTPNGMVATLGRTDFSVSHRRRVTRVHVYRGKVIVKAGFAEYLFLGEWVEKVCKGQVSFRCLRKMPRTLVLKAGQSRKIRAG